MQMDIVRANKNYKCRHCKEDIEKGDSHITRIGSTLKGEKRIYFHSRYHLGCFGKVLLDLYDKKRKPKKGSGGGRPPILDVLTKDQRKRRHLASIYLNRDKHNLIKFYEEGNASRVLDTWFLIAERIEELLTFEVPFKLPWHDDTFALLMVRNDAKITMALTEQDLKDFPKIVWDHVRAGRRALRNE